MRENCASTAPQGSQEWLMLRSSCANASAYRTMTNTDGRRSNLIATSRAHIFSKKNYYMACGTCLENVSGYVFTLITGLEYKEYGSVPYERNPRIRSSVDGAGYCPRARYKEITGDTEVPTTSTGDSERVSFILETKTPPSHVPEPYIENVWYYYQIIQNIEVLDADFALFNNIRFDPVLHNGDIMDPKSLTHTRILGKRHGYTADAICPVTIVCTVCSTSEAQHKAMLSEFSNITPVNRNLADLAPIYVETEDDGPMASNAYGKYMTEGLHIHPIGIIGQIYGEIQPVTNVNEIVPQWSEQLQTFLNTDWTSGRSTSEEHVCYAIYIIDTINIQKIDRQRGLWNEVILPIAEQYIRDFDNNTTSIAENADYIPVIPRGIKHCIIDAVEADIPPR